MKLNDGFVLRKLPGMNLVLPIGDNINTYKGALILNDTAAYIYELLQQGLNTKEIAKRMIQEYDVSDEKAEADIIRTESLLIEGGVAE